MKLLTNQKGLSILETLLVAITIAVILGGTTVFNFSEICKGFLN